MISQILHLKCNLLLKCGIQIVRIQLMKNLIFNKNLVYPDGRVCISILHVDNDINDHEDSSEK